MPESLTEMPLSYEENLQSLLGAGYKVLQDNVPETEIANLTAGKNCETVLKDDGTYTILELAESHEQMPENAETQAGEDPFKIRADVGEQTANALDGIPPEATEKKAA